LLQNEIDLAVVSGPLGDRRLKLTLLSEEVLVAVTAATHPLADRKFLRPQDFAGQTLFSYAELSTTCLYLKILQPAGVRPKETSAIPLTEAILELVKASPCCLGGRSRHTWETASTARSQSPAMACRGDGAPPFGE
jgi:LysR family transcriptional regulator for metE and metH